MFTCPICDWRVKIPRDAARPKLEDLQAWQDELQDLPFQPEEEELLKDRKSTRLNSSHLPTSRMPSSA